MTIETEKLLRFFGMCKKAGKLVAGFDAVCAALQKGQIVSVFIAQNLSPNTFSKISQKCDEFHVPFNIIPANMEEIELFLGRKTGILGVMDEGFAKKFLQMISNTPVPTADVCFPKS